MNYKANSPEDYIKQLPEDRQPVIKKLQAIISKNLPEGFEAQLSYGMLGWVVPHKIYPNGYHCNPKLPLPFINLASQKNFIALYHSGIYADPTLYEWFIKEYPKYVTTKLDMGKSCIRFKKMETVPYELIAELASKMTVAQWVSCYEKNIKTK